MDRIKLAASLIALAKELTEEPKSKVAAVPRIRYVNPALNPAINKVMPYLEDKKTIFEFVVVLLRRTGNWTLAKRLLPLMKADLGKDLEVEGAE